MRRSTLAICLVMFVCSGFVVGCGNSSTQNGDRTPIGNGPPTGDPWSDPATWPSGEVPGDGDDVVIPSGQQVLLDVDTANLGSLTIQGTLVFDEKDVELTSEWIMLHGTLGIGGPERPFPNKAIITLNGDDLDEDNMGGGTRGLMLMGGLLELHGDPPSPTWTKLRATAEAGATAIELLDEADWAPGDSVVVAPSGFYGLTATEKFAIEGTDGTTLDLDGALTTTRWGVLQYVDESGVVLEENTSVTDQVIDERAEVGNLTRNIVIRAPDDDLWKNELFGAHVMVMAGSEAKVDGVEFTRVGQAGRIARYPFHWHLLSYEDGEATEDAEGQYIKNSSIWSSAQRCIVVHGTNGVTIQGNVCYDITGHAIFLEDAVERRNVIEQNLVLKVGPVADEHVVLVHEQPVQDGGPTGFWLTNPDNTVRGNAVADTFIGVWYALPRAPLGLHQDVDMIPNQVPFGVFEDNVSHSNQKAGIMFDRPPVPGDPEGNLELSFYNPKQESDGGLVDAPFSLTNSTFYKHRSLSVWDRITAGTFEGFIVADFGDKGLAGASICTITHTLIVGSTHNTQGQDQLELPPVGLATYHSDCSLPDNIFVNLPAVPGRVSGAFAADDYYIKGVDKGLLNNAGARLINTHPGYRSPSPNTIAKGSGLEHYTFAGALWDPHGYWGPSGNYWVLDHPFLTADASCQAVSDPVHGNDQSCVGPYVGVDTFVLNGEEFNDTPKTRPLRVTREDGGLSGADAEFFVDDGFCTPALGFMRHVALKSGGTFRVDFPAGEQPADQRGGGGEDFPCTLVGATAPPSSFRVYLSNLLDGGESVVLGVSFASSATVGDGYLTASGDPTTSEAWSCFESGCTDWRERPGGSGFVPLAPVASKADVQSGACGAYFQDTADQRLWVKACRDHISLVQGDPTSRPVLYQDLELVVLND